MKIETFGEIAAKTACPGKFFLIFNLIFRKRCSAEKEVFSRFSSLDCWINLILHIVLVLNALHYQGRLPAHIGLFKDHQNAVLNDPKC